MRVIPKNKAPRITFCQIRASRWAQHAVELGLDPADVAELQERVETARLAFNAQRQARDAARSATIRMNIALAEMTNLAATMISQIRATAARDGDSAYRLASIPAPKKPSRLGTPGTPESFTAELQQVGWLTLRWKCRNPRGAVGTIYEVRRQLQSADGMWGAKEFLGVAGRKKFVDSTIPPGCRAVTYHIRAVRSTAVGEEANHSVNFGTTFRVGAPGEMQIAA